MVDFYVKHIMDDVVLALYEKGYNPKAQIEAFIKLNNPMYITKHKKAREKIQELTIEEIKEYLRQERTL